jgi:hypothetical protein
MGPWNGLDDIDKRKFMTVGRLELRPLCHPTRSHLLKLLLYLLRYALFELRRCFLLILAAEYLKKNCNHIEGSREVYEISICTSSLIVQYSLISCDDSDKKFALIGLHHSEFRQILRRGNIIGLL